MPERPGGGIPSRWWGAALLLQLVPVIAGARDAAAALPRLLLATAGLALVAGAATLLGRLVEDRRLGVVAALLAWFGSPLWIVAAGGWPALASIVAAWQPRLAPPQPAALLGLLVEPTRGLLWFAPLLAQAPFAWRRHDRKRADIVAAVVALAIYLLATTVRDWRGPGFGVVLLLPALPLLAPGSARLLARARGKGRAALGGLALTGFTVAWCAALDPSFAAQGPPGALLLLAHPALAAMGLLLGGAAAMRLLATLPQPSPPEGRTMEGATAGAVPDPAQPRQGALMRTRSLAKLALSLCVAAALAPAAHAATQTWSVLMMGNPAGKLTVDRNGSALRTHFDFNDRGRGPRVDSQLELLPDGTLGKVVNDGVEYFKGKVHEEFQLAGGKATWKNRAEQGEATVTAPAFFLSYEGSPLETGLFVAAAAKAPGQTLALLPSGKASVRRVGDLTIDGTGGKRKVVQWEVTGFGFTPASVWLTPDNAYFASVDEWQSVIPAGYEKAIPAMLAAQHTSNDAWLASIAKTLPQRSPQGVAFTGAALFDSESSTVRPGMTVLVLGDRVAAVGADGTVTIPAGARVIDARGKTLIPGLWDMHEHVGDVDGLLNLAAGVTTIRDLGNDTDSLLARKKKWDEGTAIGPRVELGGLIDGPGPYAGPTKVLVDTPEKATAAVDEFARLGYQQIKIYSSVKPELVPVIAKRAHEKGLRVSGHIPAQMIAEQAIADGYDEVQHVNFLFLDLWPEITETRTPARFTEVAERAADVDLGAPPAQKLIDLMRKRDIVSDPTLTAFEGLMVDRAGQVPDRWQPVVDRLPPLFRRGMLAGGLPVPEGKDARYRASFQKTLDMVKALHDAGVRIVAGTDGVAGFDLHHELELYVKAGIPAPEVLRIATLGAAQVMHRDAERGSITPGKLADIDVVDGDPTKDITAVRHIGTVMKAGVVYDTNALYGAIGVGPAK